MKTQGLPWLYFHSSANGARISPFFAHTGTKGTVAEVQSLGPLAKKVG